MPGYFGDLRLGDTIDVKFCTTDTSGVPTTLAASPVISAYPGNSTTQLTAGITLSVDFDSVTGLHNVRVVASNGNGYATATNYALIITTGTVGGSSVVGYEVGSFSIENRSALMPATAGRTLVVDASGLADATAVKLGPSGSGTAQTARDVGLSVLLSSGTGTGQLSLSSGVAQADAAKINGVATSSVTTVAANLGTTQPVNFTGTAGSALVKGDAIDLAGQTITAAAGVTFPSSVASPTNITAGTITTVTNLTNAPTSGDLTSTMKTSVVTAAWDTVLSGHLTSGTTGAALNSAGSAGDPWSTTLPGSYGAGTAGHIVGTALPDIAPGSANGLFRGGSNAATSITTALTANVIGNVTGNLSGSVGSVTGNVGGNVTGTVASVVGNVGGNVVGSVASVTAGVTVTTNNDKTSYALSAAGNTATADALLKRDWTAVTGEAARSVLNALRFLRNKWSISAGTVTVTTENDTTTAWTGAVTQTAGNPVSSIDPA